MSTFMNRKVRTTYHGLNSVTCLAPGIWEQVAEAERCCNSLKK